MCAMIDIVIARRAGRRTGCSASDLRLFVSARRRPAGMRDGWSDLGRWDALGGSPDLWQAGLARRAGYDRLDWCWQRLGS